VGFATVEHRLLHAEEHADERGGGDDGGDELDPFPAEIAGDEARCCATDEGDSEENPAVDSNPVAALMREVEVRDANLDESLDGAVEGTEEDTVNVPLAAGLDVAGPEADEYKAQTADEKDRTATEVQA